MQTDKLNFGEGRVASLHNLSCVAVCLGRNFDCHAGHIVHAGFCKCATKAVEQFAEMSTRH